MKIVFCIQTVTVALFLSLGAAPRHTFAQSPVLVDEPTEWTWSVRPNHVNPVLPNVLLIGDSITRAYYPQVAKQLAGKANCFLFATSASAGDPRLPGQIDDLFKLYPEQFSVIHFNNGMHGWGYTEPQWSAGVSTLLAQLRQKAPAAKLVWTTITPVLTDDPAGATNPRIDARNQLALALMQPQHVPVDDQHTLMIAHQDLHADRVHFKAEGSTLQADQVVKSILPIQTSKP
jgi:lysophospholipase L1-like esterase